MLFYLYVYILDGEEVYFYAGSRTDADKQFEEKFGTAPTEKQYKTRRRA